MTTISHIRRSVFDEMMLGLLTSLENRNGITDIRLLDKTGLETHMIKSWEHKVSCNMPEDLKIFYQTTDGLCLTWNACVGEVKYNVGRIRINSLNQLVRIGGINCSNSNNQSPSLLDVEDDYDDEDKTLHPGIKTSPHFDGRSRLFEIDSCDGFGKICLVYADTKPGLQANNPEIWFLDRTLDFHYLADSFYSYFNMIVVHMGICDWQYLFTNYGLPPQARKWFDLFIPIRLMISEGNYIKEQQKISNCQFNSDLIFKDKVKREKFQSKALNQLNTQNGNIKRKPGSLISSRLSQSSGKQQQSITNKLKST